MCICLTPRYGDSRNVSLSSVALGRLRGLPRKIHVYQVVVPLHHEALKNSWQRACEKACISGLRFHDLRHEATSRIFEKGLNVMEGFAITDHKYLIILQVYTHLRSGYLVRKFG